MIAFWRVVWYRAGTFLLCDHVRARRGRRGHGVAVAVPWRGRRALDVVTPLGVAVARRGRGCGARRLCVAVVWLRHADEC